MSLNFPYIGYVNKEPVDNLVVFEKQMKEMIFLFLKLKQQVEIS
jgi:hypothetical protein